MTEHATISAGTPAASLPAWHTVLAVVAHPDDESFGLGAVLDAFRRGGTAVAVLCLTRGEATTLHGAGDVTGGRERELTAAGRELGVASTRLLHHPDGELSRVPRHLLADDVIDEVGAVRADGLLVFDRSGVTGHPDHQAATSAALLAAAVLDLPVLAWTLPESVAGRLNDELRGSFSGQPAGGIDVDIAVDRTRQIAAVEAHATQATPDSALWRRLELLGDQEHLRWLYRPERAAHPARPDDGPGADEGPDTVRAVHLDRDRFEIRVRGHRLFIDQPESLGGDDTAPAPIEVFVSGLAGCIAFYVRRYLARHGLPTEGLAVTARYTMGQKPARVTDISVHVQVPDGVPEERLQGLLAVASHCTARNTLAAPPDIEIGLSPATR